MNRLIFQRTLLVLACFPLFAQASANGFYMGLGSVATINDDNPFMDTDGLGFELGYNFNKIVGIEYKSFKSDGDADGREKVKLNGQYFGANIGHDFNTGWFKLYGKVGLYNAKEEISSQYGKSTYKDTSPALGFGVAFYPTRDLDGIYIKLDSLVTDFYGDTVGFGNLTVGYHF